MAWRLHEHVVRGEIDNRTRGRVTGRIWMEGTEQPLVLDLAGDCWPDLAGCLLTFENPAPVAMTTKAPVLLQRGQVGCITAARKVRVFDVPLEEALRMLKLGEKPPEHIANSIYLEWFSPMCGRMVVESSDYRLQISEPAWQLSAEELETFNRLWAEAREDAAAIQEIHPDTDWDEFRSEQFIRENDMTSEKYGRLLEKYARHPDAERIIASEMGWTELVEAVDAQAGIAESDQESDDDVSLDDLDDGFDESDLPVELPDPARKGIDWMLDENGRVIHPLAKRARELGYELVREVDGLGILEDRYVLNFVVCLRLLGVKLTSALGFIARDSAHLDRGMVIARLKRALDLHNENLTAAKLLVDHPQLPADRLAFYRAELFRIREAMLQMITELRAR